MDRMIMNEYSSLLEEGERFYSGHTNLTMFEIKDSLNVFNISGRLPDCLWEEIQYNHATNYSTIWQLTSRWINKEYPDVVCCAIKPTKTFLQWIYDGLMFAKQFH